MTREMVSLPNRLHYTQKVRMLREQDVGTNQDPGTVCWGGALQATLTAES